MFGRKKLLCLLIAAVMVSACGGGSDDNNGTSPLTNNGGGSTTAPNTDTGNPAPGGNDDGDAIPADGGPNNPPPQTENPGEDNPDPVAPGDAHLAGYLSIVANQMPYITTDRSIYNAVSLNQFESTLGMYDFASGSKGDDSTATVPPSAPAPAAPIAAFGFRVDKFVQPSAESEQVGNQTVVGRVAFDLTERPDSPGIGANEAAEIMRFVLDGVELSTNANGELVSARVLDGAQIHVYGRSAGNVEVRESFSMPNGSVRLLPMTAVLDNYGDNSSIVLLMDLENAFSQAGQRLAVLENIAGHFSMKVTLSSVQMVRPAEDATDSTPALERKELVGEAITVNDQRAVNGAGVVGNAWIRMYPPQP